MAHTISKSQEPGGDKVSARAPLWEDMGQPARCPQRPKPQLLAPRPWALLASGEVTGRTRPPWGLISQLPSCSGASWVRHGLGAGTAWERHSGLCQGGVQAVFWGLSGLRPALCLAALLLRGVTQ